MSETKSKIISLLNEIRPYENIDSDTNLLDDGILDSMAILGFVTRLEDELDIIVPEDSITRANFATVETISVFLKSCNKGEF